MSTPSSPPAFLILLTRLTALLWLHFGALPRLHRAGSFVRCTAHTLDGRVREELPPGAGPTPEDAVRAMLTAFAEALPWEPWYIPRGAVAHNATDGACGCDLCKVARTEATPASAAPLTLTVDDVLVDHGTGAIDTTFATTPRAEVA